MAVKNINHNTGIKATNGNKIIDYYIDKRKQFLELLAQINEEYRLSLINSDIIKFTEELKSNAPNIFDTYLQGDLFLPGKYFGMNRENEIAMASYIEFLKILKNKYDEVEKLKLKSGEIKWIGDYSKFIELHHILNEYEFVKCDLLRFRQFLSFRAILNFNLNKFNTSILFYELNLNRFISEPTLNRLIENNQIIGINGRYNQIIQSPINMKTFQDNKSRYTGGKPNNKIDPKLNEAMSVFGIQFR